MTEFVNNNPSLQVPIAIWRSSVPQIHPAASILTIWWCHEVGVVESTAILSVCDDSVILLTPTTKIVLLEIAGNLVKAIPETRRLAKHEAQTTAKTDL
jgi:hypothetical protein